MMCMHVLVVLYSLYRIAFVYSCCNMEFFRVSSPITTVKDTNSYVSSDDYNCG